MDFYRGARVMAHERAYNMFSYWQSCLCVEELCTSRVVLCACMCDAVMCAPKQHLRKQQTTDGMEVYVSSLVSNCPIIVFFF